VLTTQTLDARVDRARVTVVARFIAHADFARIGILIARLTGARIIARFADSTHANFDAGTVLSVIAVHWASSTNAAVARIVNRARVAIVAHFGVPIVCTLTAAAGVVGAGIAVVTIKRTSNTRSARTGVVSRAGIAIVAGFAVGEVQAYAGITTVIRAEVAVVTIQEGAGTFTGRTRII
jgi:hypothetical protein